MRLITFRRDREERIGAWIDNDRQVVDLAQAAALTGDARPGAYDSMQRLIESGPAAWDAARALAERPPAEAVFPTTDCTLLAPIPRPIQMRDCLCFPGHLAGTQRVQGERIIARADDPVAKRAELEAAGYFETPAAYFDFPVYYTTNSLAVHGPDVDVTWPSFSRFIDYELEWAAIIGLGGDRISREAARDHIFGYTIFNDWSARDEQMRVMGAPLNLGPSAGKDFANGLGPCIVTADEIPDPYALSMIARVNGEQVSVGSTSGMHFRFEDLIAHLTRAHALYPGEVIGSGTVGGGCSVETGRRVLSGDVIELEVERIGTLRNRVVAPHLDKA